MNEFNTIRHFFDFLNKNCDYLILRNWDDIFDDGIYGNGHEDIDILCRNLVHFVKLTDAKRVHLSKYRDNFVVKIGHLNVRFDVRHVGDGYYPTKWEDVMLNNKVLTKQGVYIMKADDYAYSLAYHALLQKPTLSNEYKRKIIDALGFIGNPGSDMSEKDILKLLQFYCRMNKYYVEIPSDPGVFLNKLNMSGFECSGSIVRIIRRLNLKLSQIILHNVSKLRGGG